MSECTHKRLNVLLVVCCALGPTDNKPLSKISVLLSSFSVAERKEEKKTFHLPLPACTFDIVLKHITAPAAYSPVFFLSDIPASPSAG